MKFRNLKLQNWKNFSQAQIALQDRMFIVGANASGKSNLLDAFRFLRDLVILGGGFQEAIARRGGVSAVRCLAARRNAHVIIEAQIASDDGALWAYELSFNEEQHTPKVIRERVSRNDVVLLERPNEADLSDPEQLTKTHLEQLTVNKAFRELASFFASIRYLHIVPQLMREPDRSVGRVNDPFGGDFLEQVARSSAKTRSARLRRIREMLKIAAPQLQMIELWRDHRGTPHLRGKYAHWRPQGAWQTEEQFSDGTLRLIGLLWALLDADGPLLLEEPELSLHPGLIRHLPQMFARIIQDSSRQIFISTHSTDLLSDDGIGLDEVALLIPDKEGTQVRLAASFAEAQALLEGGLSMAEVVLPMTEPPEATQFSLFKV
ncbi:MAG: AAA family ATPase [Thermoflexales bacterium]